MKRYIGIYKMFLKNALMREMEYRVEFFVSLFHVLLWGSFQILFYKLIYANVSTIGSWKYPEMLILVGTFMIIDAIFFTFIFRNLADFDALIRRGELDRILVRPIDSQFAASARLIMPKEFINLFVGIFVVIYGLNMIQMVPNAFQLIGYLVFIVCSIMVVYSLGFIVACFGFYFEKAEDLHEVVIHLWQFAKLPDVYTGIVKILFMSVAPIVFASYIPTGFLLGKAPSWFVVYYFFMSIGIFWFARVFWKASLKKYKSAGG